MKYVIETDTFVTGWVNCSTGEDGYPLVFDTREEAQAELDDHLAMLCIDRDLGNIEDVNPEDYRITEVTE